MKQKISLFYVAIAFSIAARSRKSKWNFRNEEDGLHLYRYIMSMFDKRQAILERGLGNIGYNSVTKEGIKLAEKCVQKCSVFTG